MRYFVITLILGAVIGFGCAKAFDQSAVASAPPEVDDVFTPGALLGLAHFEVEEGTDLDAFGEHLRANYYPVWQEAYDKMGMKFIPVEVEKGDKVGTYGFIIYIPDLETRNKYFTTEGWTDAFNKIVEKADAPPFPEDFEGFIQSNHYGDHIMFP